MNTKSEHNFTKFKECEKKTKKIVRQAKRRYEKKLSSKENKKLFNSYVQVKTKSRSGVGPLSQDGHLVSDNKSMADILNSYFGSVFTNNTPNASQYALNQRIFGEPVTQINITPNDIVKKIKNLKPNSAAGPDNIPARFLQTFSTLISEPLALIFNKSIETGTVPPDWRCGNITPIFKKGSKSSPGNYRPVSLTSIPCKILESYIKDRVTEHLYDNILI